MTVEAVAQEAAKEMTKPMEEAVLPEERKTSWKRTGFTLMPLEWGPDEKIMMRRVHEEIRYLYVKAFPDLVDLEMELLLRVRTPEVVDGEIVRDKYGFPIWKRTTTGAYIEDWQQMSVKEREGYFHRIYTSLFDWERRRNEAFTEAMFAKAGWEEAFAEGYLNSGGRTERDREERGKAGSMTERYFALYKNSFADLVRTQVSTVEKFGQRLKDVHQAASGR